MTAIKTNDLTKRFGAKTAVDVLNLEIEQGTLVALLGVNGAGKTTTIKMLSCLVKPTGGDATLLGHSVCKDPAAVKRIINLSPQETAVAPNLTVRENLEFIAGIYGAARAEAAEKAGEMLITLGLEDVEKQKAKTLSGGMQRRLSIAMALITGPEVLFLDEPTLGVDVLARREVWNAVEKLKGKITIILTTHYMEEAEALADKIAVMADGRLKAMATAQELKTQTGAATLEEAFVALATGQTPTDATGKGATA